MGDLYGTVSRTAEGFVSRLTEQPQRCGMAGNIRGVAKRS
jgi:hypothetical protein